MRAAQYTQRAMQTEQKRYLESLESSSVLAKGALLLEQKWCLGPWSSSVHTQQERCRYSREDILNAFRAVQYSAQERCSKIREGVLESLRAAQYLQKQNDPVRAEKVS